MNSLQKELLFFLKQNFRKYIKIINVDTVSKDNIILIIIIICFIFSFFKNFFLILIIILIKYQQRLLINLSKRIETTHKIMILRVLIRNFYLINGIYVNQ